MTSKKSKSAARKPPEMSAEPAKPEKEGAPVDQTNSGEEAPDGGFTLSLNGDGSLQAYKDWVHGMYLGIVSDAEDTVTEEQWIGHWDAFWSKMDAAADEGQKIPPGEGEEARIERWKKLGLEERYPGIIEQIERFENAILPLCPYCGSEDTASVQVGIIGRTITINALTRKFHLVPNGSDKMGEYCCNQCRRFFD